jgi:glycosyltransferase involved in cell wall biosynthesis
MSEDPREPGDGPPVPRVSIGLPVFNGERYVARTLDSLLAQTFGDFELIIADNASSDGTEAICRAYVMRDPRVSYHRAAVNQGIVANFNRCVALARAAYFKWQAADDLVAPTFLERCLAVLEADPAVVLAFARSLIIDENDEPVRAVDYDADADDPRPHVRFGRLIHIDHHRHAAQEVYGVIRSDALRRTPGYERCVRADSILLARLALLGRFRAVEERLFLNREHQDRSVRLVPGERARRRSRFSKWLGSGPVPPPEFWDPALTGKVTFPEWRILREYARSLGLAPLSARERNRCRVTLARFALKHTPKLARDLLIATEHTLLGRPRR